MIKDVACVILVNSEGKILLQHRCKKAEILADYWGFFGGKIEDKETADEAVKREAFEELSIYLQNPKLVHIQDLVSKKFSDAVFKGLKYIFIEYWNDEQRLELNDGQKMEWVDINEAKQKKIASHDLQVLEEIALYV